MITVVYWDYNGVILADSKICYEADLRFCLHFGGREFTFRQWQLGIRIPSIDFYVDHGCSRERLENSHEEMGEVFHGAYEPLAAKCRTRSGVRQTLEFLRSRDILAAIASNHTLPEIRQQIRRLKLHDMFTTIMANEDRKISHIAQTKKGRIEAHLKQWSQWGRKPRQGLIIGDTEEEIKIGKELGLVTVAITGGYHHASRLKGANHTINRVSDLIPIIKQYR